MPLPDPTDHEPIQGPRLRLRPITPGDLPDLMRWLGDPEVMAFYGRPLTSLAEARGEFLEPSNLPCWRFIIEADGRAVGEVQYYYTYAEVTWSAGIDIFIGEPDARGRGLGAEAIRTLLRYLFETKGVSRVVDRPRAVQPPRHPRLREGRLPPRRRHPPPREGRRPLGRRRLHDHPGRGMARRQGPLAAA